jgi:hypothetical protein
MLSALLHSPLGRIACLCLLLTSLNSWAQAPDAAKAAKAWGEDFDHFSTGFALDGQHARIECEACHSRGVFEGTPSQCVNCHREGGVVNSPGKPPHHIQSTDVCEDCHTTAEWSYVAKVDHTQVLGRCDSCHNGFNAEGKPANHIPVDANCADCHVTAEWASAFFNHDKVGDNCVSCHNGTQATGKPSNHILATNQCVACHLTQNWSVASNRVDHAEVIGTCVSCHNGQIALGKPVDHIQATENCESCHLTQNWSVAPNRVDHAEVIGTCASCHNGTLATGKPPTGQHIEIRPGAECDSCHQSSSWMVSSARVDHTQVFGSCVSCHGPGGLADSRKTPDHLNPTTDNCEACHLPGPSAWSQVPFVDHAEIPTNNCLLCHSPGGQSSVSKPVNHIPSVNTCDLCHSPQLRPGQGFKPVDRVDHENGIFPITQDCLLCHNDTAQFGLPILGKMTANQIHPWHTYVDNNCDACHKNTLSFSGVPKLNVDHSALNLDQCVFCHSGRFPNIRGQSNCHPFPTGPLSCGTAGCHEPNPAVGFPEIDCNP